MPECHRGASYPDAGAQTGWVGLSVCVCMDSRTVPELKCIGRQRRLARKKPAARQSFSLFRSTTAKAHTKTDPDQWVQP